MAFRFPHSWAERERQHWVHEDVCVSLVYYTIHVFVVLSYVSYIGWDNGGCSGMGVIIEFVRTRVVSRVLCMYSWVWLLCLCGVYTFMSLSAVYYVGRGPVGCTREGVNMEFVRTRVSRLYIYIFVLLIAMHCIGQNNCGCAWEGANSEFWRARLFRLYSKEKVSLLKLKKTHAHV